MIRIIDIGVCFDQDLSEGLLLLTLSAAFFCETSQGVGVYEDGA